MLLLTRALFEGCTAMQNPGGVLKFLVRDLQTKHKGWCCRGECRAGAALCVPAAPLAVPAAPLGHSSEGWG